ncbi:MAG: quinol:cytochrome C oxidoreductase [Pirellulaceae bacterium]|nr:quinol:cytochrome C oxidoreductase [Pirellulaceae bacterium]
MVATANTILNDDDSLPSHWRAAAPVLMAVGAVSILVSLALCYLASPGDQRMVGFETFLHSYLANFMYCLTFCVGALFFVLVTHLARAAWCATIRRVAEIIAVTVAWWAVLFLPVLAMVLLTKSDALFPWNGEDNGLAADKLMYLNGKWFAVRAIVYFGIWVVAASYFFTKSREQDETGSAEISLKLQRYSGPLIMLFALSLNFAAFDWVMSLDPTWFSTMFGVYIFAGSMMAFFAFMIITFTSLQRNGRVQKYVNVEHFHDMSKFLFGFVFFWSYITFSQFLLIWYGNIPEETIWFKHRMEGGWQYVGLLIILGHFAFPMLCLLSRHIRRNRTIMCGWSIWLLFMHWVDITFMILPNTGPTSVMMWLGHAVCGVGMVSVFLSLLILRVGSTPLVAKRNPWIPEALSYHVM